MRSRTYRGTQGNHRKTIGAVVVGGVLVAAGLTGVQFASASTTPKAADLISVDGLQFDISQCQKLEINGPDVLCDGEKLAPEQEQNAGDAALASAQALEAACDTFAADSAAAAGQNAGDQAAGDQAAEDPAAAGEQSAATKAAIKKAAKKWTKAMKAADAADDKGAADDQAAVPADAAAAVTSAQQSLLQACLTLADIKAVAGAGDAGGADDQAGAEPSESADPGASEAAEDSSSKPND